MMAARSLIVIFLVIFVAAAAHSQSDTGAYSESEVYKPDLSAFVHKKDRLKKKDKDKNKIEGEEASVPASIPRTELQLSFGVFDSKWNPVTDIKREEVELFLNDEKQVVTSIEPRTHPLDLVFLIDMSPSVTFRVDNIRTWLQEVIKTLAPNDRVSLVAFSYRYRTLLDSSTDRIAVSKALAKLDIDDGTSLYDAIETTTKVSSWAASPKVVLLVSDGVDTTSTKSRFTRSLEAAAAANIEFYPVYLDTLADQRASAKKAGRILPFPVMLRGALSAGTNEQEYENGRKYLTQLLRLTGGMRLMFPTAEKDISPAAKSVSETLGARYSLRLTSANLRADSNGLVDVRIRVRRPELRIVTRSVLRPR